MGFLDRLFRISKAKSNEAITKMELKNLKALAYQDILNAKEQLVEAQKAQASALQQKNALAKKQEALLQRVEALKEKAKILKEQGNDELLMEVFEEIQNLQSEANGLKSQLAKAIQDCHVMDKVIKDLKNNIKIWEQKVKAAENRIKLQESRASIKKMAASVDAMSVANTIDKMDEMADNQEAEADAYTHLVDSEKTLEEKINDSINKEGANSEFEKFKNSL